MVLLICLLVCDCVLMVVFWYVVLVVLVGVCLIVVCMVVVIDVGIFGGI